ncbi:MAG: carbamoyl-phosphate synthase large subunit, partial [Eggerthellaceae bacterium]|nr:carbamoyl-phosphate synthase large subunit [Eggerthellaceae bacterium]
PDNSVASNGHKVMILGGGPNRIGQGIEFDYCCVQACFALRRAGFEIIMVNCNPETVSTDYDTSDLLFFEPLTLEDVLDVVEATAPEGVIVTLGGQTPLKLAAGLEAAGVRLLGTSSASIALAENRDDFAALLDELGIAYPPARMASSYEEAQAAAAEIGYPLLVRPSFVLGGRGMGIVYAADQLRAYMEEATRVTPDHPVYLDRFLEDAIELDVDCLADGDDVYIGGILEHVEMAGIHSGDSATCLPPFTLSAALQTEVRRIARELARHLQVVGLLNIQFAVHGSRVYVIEANPRASRTVPFVSKATGVALAKAAARLMCGEKLADLGLPPDDAPHTRYCVKEAVMPFGRFPGTDVILGPEMKSTGEVMGIGRTFPEAYLKTQVAVGYELPQPGEHPLAFISVNDNDKRAIGSVAFALHGLGFRLAATAGTARVLRALGLACAVVRPASDAGLAKWGAEAADAPRITDLIAAGDVKLIINTPSGEGPHSDGFVLRTAAVAHGLTYVTTLQAAQAFAIGLEALADGRGPEIVALQDLDKDRNEGETR